MLTARSALKKVGLAIVVSSAALVFPLNTWAASGNVQICQPSASCTIGEFLYNDSYVPITTASCSITSRYPNGTLLLNSVNMPVSAEGDGWYAYTFTAPATLGLYRTEVKCITGSETLALDKSFEVKTAESTLTSSDVAGAVWGYSTRTLSSFGNLISDIWNSATRTLTGVGLGTGSLASKSDVSETRNLFEKIVNKPTIQLNLEFDEDRGELESKIDQTTKVANQLQTTVQYLKSKGSLVWLKWDDLDRVEIKKTLTSASVIIGSPNDSLSKTTLFGQVSFLKNSWDWKVTDELFKQAKDTSEKFELAKASLERYGKTAKTRAEVKTLLASLSKLESLTGKTRDSSKEKSLFRSINKVRELANGLNAKSKEADILLSQWNKFSFFEIQKKVDSLKSEVLALSTLPKIKELLSIFTKTRVMEPEKKLKNSVLAIKGIITTSKKFIARSRKTPFDNTWLEEGSLVFKTLITNPSLTTSQEVPFTYYLPKEIKKEDIIETDENLTVHYDPDKDQYFVKGDFVLKAGETKTVYVRVDDKVFEISESEIEGLKKQAEELQKTVENTSYSAQGVILKSDIEVILNKILANQKDAITPEARIKVYREAAIELDAVREKIDKLKEIASDASSAGTFFGFVGGAQAIAVWGLILVMSAGFVFLALYMRMLTHQNSGVVNGSALNLFPASLLKAKVVKESTGNVHSVHPAHSAKIKSSSLKLACLVLIFAGSVAFLSTLIASKVTPSGNTRTSRVQSQVPDATSQSANTEQASKVLGVAEDPEGTEAFSPGVKIKVYVPGDSVVNVFERADIASRVLAGLEGTTEAFKIAQRDDWVKIQFDPSSKEEIKGWVDASFIEDFEEPKEVSEKTPRSVYKDVLGVARIVETPTGFLRVREGPWGEELTRVNPGEKFPVNIEENGWLQIGLPDGTVGWIFKKYTTTGD